MAIYQTLVRFDDGTFAYVSTIEHEGGLWLVPEWLPAPSPGMHTPVRMIRMDLLRHHFLGPTPMGDAKRHYVLDDPVPKSVLSGIVPKQLAPLVSVLEHPDLMIPE